MPPSERAILILVSLILPILSSAALRLTSRQTESVVYERFHVESSIVARYATTSITSVILNNAEQSKELSFQVQLPDTAFISSFSMTVNGTTYIGIARDRENATKEFEQRQDAGENVGLVESRGKNLFRIRINTAASSRSTFVLGYEELILRQLSKYQQLINLNPGSVVDDVMVTVRVKDEQGIPIFSASDFVTTNRVSNKEIVYTYAPSMADQMDDERFGLARDMMVEYDVNHPDEGAGLIITNDCYFAQFFSPSGIPPISVDIVFVIDVSGSMSGLKIEQARDSLVAVINQLRPSDRFTIVTFESEVSVWKNQPVSVAEFRDQGVEYAMTLRADGGTNFTGGMSRGIQILKDNRNLDYVQLLVILTDGEPTVGITSEGEIIRIAQSSLDGTRISINTLGFGVSLNYNLLVRLALSSRGIAMRIYEGSDAAEQLEGFYEEITSPILHTIEVTYPSNTLETVSKRDFPLLFNGSEIVVAGKFLDDVCSSNSGSITVMVRGMGTSNELTFQSEINPGRDTVIAGVQPPTERLVAYFTIRQLLDDIRITEDEATIWMLGNRSLALALQYNFVTELTSLIVVESSTNETNPLNDSSTNLGDLGSPEMTLDRGGGNFFSSGLSASSDSSIAVVVVVVVMVVISTIVIIVVVLVVRSRKRRSNRALNQISSLQLVTPEESEDVDGSSPEKHDQ